MSTNVGILFHDNPEVYAGVFAHENGFIPIFATNDYAEARTTILDAAASVNIDPATVGIYTYLSAKPANEHIALLDSIFKNKR